MTHTKIDPHSEGLEFILDIISRQLSGLFSLPDNKQNADSNCFRVFNGTSDDVPMHYRNLTIDFFVDSFLIQIGQNQNLPESQISKIVNILPQPYLVLLKVKKKINEQYSFDIKWLRGKALKVPFKGYESNVHYLLEIENSLDVGIHLDTAELRKWLQKNCQDKRVLNLFSYTCSLGLAAMKGKALDAINVDSSATALSQGKKNYTLNSINPNPRSFNKMKVKKFLDFEKKKKAKYDIIIIDPSPPPGKAHDLESKFTYLCKWLRPCLQLINLDGKIIITNHIKNISDSDFIKGISDKLQISNLSLVEKVPYPASFKLAVSKAFVFELISNQKPQEALGTKSENNKI